MFNILVNNSLLLIILINILHYITTYSTRLSTMDLVNYYLTK